MARNGPTSPRRRGRPTKDARTFEPRERDNGYVSRLDGRHVHFVKAYNPVKKLTTPRSRSPGKRMADFNEDLYYASDERKVRMDRMAEEWMAYNQTMPPPSTV